jgi:hypothetical protein
MIKINTTEENGTIDASTLVTMTLAELTTLLVCTHGWTVEDAKFEGQTAQWHLNGTLETIEYLNGDWAKYRDEWLEFLVTYHA